MAFNNATVNNWSLIMLLMIVHLTHSTDIFNNVSDLNDNNKTADNKIVYLETLLKDEKLGLSDLNNESALDSIRNDGGYIVNLSTNESNHKSDGDIKEREKGKRIPIWEIVLQSNGVDVGGESPIASGRQLVDIKEKDEDRMLSTVPVKNGSLQRDNKDGIKAKNENKTIVQSVIKEKSADAEKVIGNVDFSTGGKRKDKFLVSTVKETTVNSADKAYFFPPMPLVSDDCNEMKTDSLKNISNQREKDMEFLEKENLVFFGKVSNYSPDMRNFLVPDSRGVSHVHRFDKSRRAVKDYKANFYTPKGKSKINNIEFEVESDEYKMKNIPFETDVKLKMGHNFDTFEQSLLDQVPMNANKINSKNLPRESKYDFFKKKILNNNIDVNKSVSESDTQMINTAEMESNIKTSKSIATEVEHDIFMPSGLNVSLKKTKDEKWSAWHERERDRDTMIRFSVGMSRENYITPTLHLSEGTFLFRFLSSFFAFLQPFDFPSELLRDVMLNTISVPQLILQSIRVEVGFIIAIIFALIMALVVPAYGLCCALLRIVGGISTHDREASSPTPGMVNDANGPCEKRICLFMMLIIVLISFTCVLAMILANESASSSISLVKDLISAAMRDIPTYAQATHQSMSHILLHGADQTISAMEHDLNRVDKLLGEPVQAALSAETGIDVALDALSDITSVSNGLSEKVLALGACGSRAAALTATAKERLKDLKRQADMAKRHCASSRDRPLCETADTNGIELVMQFDMVTEVKMESLATILQARNLSQATDTAREQFNDIPMSIANQTYSVIEEIKDALYNQRLNLQVSERGLTKAALHITAEITREGRHIENAVRSVDALEFWRWITFLLAVLLICLVILLHIVALSCGCCGVENHAGASAKTSLVVMCLFAIPLWLLAIVVFVAGGHGEVYMCRPLYDEPQYAVLGKLLDKPGLLYKNESGFFQEMFKELNNITINVPVANVLRECKHNRPAYPVFRLREILDMNAATAHYNWTAMQGVKEKLTALAPTPAAYLSTPKALEELKFVIRGANSMNFTNFRHQMNGPLTGKDLNALADQFESIANQITDLTTSSRVETLASRTRRLSINTIQPLEQLRTEIVFRLTELELQLQPFNKQVNQSLSHLKTIQYYIDNQGTIITEKKVQAYVNRLTGYLEQYRGHVLNHVENHLAPCGPLWDIYDAGRSLVCKHYVDSLNGFWFGLACSLLVWVIASPLTLRFRRACRASRDRKEGILLRTISHQSSSENAAISDQSGWGVTGEQGSDHWR